MKTGQGYPSVGELAHNILTQNTLDEWQPASGATFCLLEFLLALFVVLLLELPALRNDGAICSVGFRQRQTTHTGHVIDAHSIDARESQCGGTKSERARPVTTWSPERHWSDRRERKGARRPEASGSVGSRAKHAHQGPRL